MAIENAPTPLQQLLAHLATCPSLPEQLHILHNLALYDSGDALLGREEKDALLAAKQLADLLKRVPTDAFSPLL